MKKIFFLIRKVWTYREVFPARQPKVLFDILKKKEIESFNDAYFTDDVSELVGDSNLAWSADCTLDFVLL